MTDNASRELACSLGQHEWTVDPEDIRFRECVFCGTTEYLGKEVKKSDTGDKKKRSGKD